MIGSSETTFYVIAVYFWRGEDKKHAPCDTGGAAGRPCGVSRLGMDMRADVG